LTQKTERVYPYFHISHVKDHEIRKNYAGGRGETTVKALGGDPLLPEILSSLLPLASIYLLHHITPLRMKKTTPVNTAIRPRQRAPLRHTETRPF